jgi:hypothetical protein
MLGTFGDIRRGPSVVRHMPCCADRHAAESTQFLSDGTREIWDAFNAFLSRKHVRSLG